MTERKPPETVTRQLLAPYDLLEQPTAVEPLTACLKFYTVFDMARSRHLETAKVQTQTKHVAHFTNVPRHMDYYGMCVLCVCKMHTVRDVMQTAVFYVVLLGTQMQPILCTPLPKPEHVHLEAKFIFFTNIFPCFLRSGLWPRQDTMVVDSYS